jgi:hypothetical protein
MRLPILGACDLELTKAVPMPRGVAIDARHDTVEAIGACLADGEEELAVVAVAGAIQPGPWRARRLNGGRNDRADEVGIGGSVTLTVCCLSRRFLTPFSRSLATTSGAFPTLAGRLPLGTAVRQSEKAAA